ncbi:MAG: 5'-methylthioadenosine nucleosidase [Burkholderiaceae bacterium]
MSGSILIVTALPQELDDSLPPNDLPVVFTGVGKVNAALAVLEAIAVYRPQLIVNFGTAGRVSDRVHGLVEVSRVIQRDMNAEPLAPRGQTPFQDDRHGFDSGQPGVICATGDSFVTSRDPWLVEQGVDLVDMELFAIAAACERAGVSWRSFKYITDDANEDSGDHWETNVHLGRDLFFEKLATL